MIEALVKSAFQNRCLSVESEGLIRQVLAMKGYRAKDLDALQRLCDAVNNGQIQREAPRHLDMPLQRQESLNV
ncbi:hypothetical protein JJD41_08240 [Oxynema sp. CENA135]|uniref:hypothetical protein n=1 Tax=Oxynema sp. CENA135 TaxID=984206 RepID=UPI00190C9E2D|nr:hypothetical protein [Oxynema sp. CENA135]MBK4729853.1 hypothetical protein [Oxynema sp. CENA135]